MGRFPVGGPTRAPGAGPAVLHLSFQSHKEGLLPLNNAWHTVAPRKESLSEWTYTQMEKSSGQGIKRYKQLGIK